jgi:VanZ family protein
VLDGDCGRIGCDLLCSALFGSPVLKVSWLTRLAQLAFLAALLFTFYSAVIPPQKAVQLVPWDKAEHFLAFYALTGLGVAAFPRRNLFVIAALLSAFGALIEFVQGLSIVHRDRDFWDWVADTVAVVMALAPMILVWWRRVARSGQKKIDI